MEAAYKASFLLILFLNFCHSKPNVGRFEPNWDSLDKRVAPTWYDEAKIGVFMHWGVYSVPGFSFDHELAEWFWWVWKGKQRPSFVDFMKKHYPPNFDYQDFAPQWKAEFFDPDAWADLVKESGAKYFIITSKHHEGFTLWKSNVSWNWNAVDNGPHRDILGDLEKSFRSRTDVHYCLYHSLFEWFHPLYLEDKANNFKTTNYVDKVLFPQMYDYVTRYKPDYIWSDGDWEASWEYWKSPQFLAWLYNDSPVKDKVLVNDRWGQGTSCKHGDVKTCGIDRYNPHKKQNFKFENAMTIDHYSWGWRRNAPLNEYLTMFNLTEILAQTVSCGGNMVMNIGPTADGLIPAIFQERLRQMGSWLKVNGEAIYSSKPWRVQNDTEAGRVWYTSKDNLVYAIVLDWPTDGLIHLTNALPTPHTRVFMLGYGEEIAWKAEEHHGMVIDVSGMKPTDIPCNWAWVFKLFYVE